MHKGVLSTQSLDLNLRIKPPLVGTRASADTIKARYRRSGFTDLCGVVLRFADLLALGLARGEHERLIHLARFWNGDDLVPILVQYMAGSIGHDRCHRETLPLKECSHRADPSNMGACGATEPTDRPRPTTPRPSRTRLISRRPFATSSRNMGRRTLAG